MEGFGPGFFGGLGRHGVAQFVLTFLARLAIEHVVALVNGDVAVVAELVDGVEIVVERIKRDPILERHVILKGDDFAAQNEHRCIHLHECEVLFQPHATAVACHKHVERSDFGVTGVFEPLQIGVWIPFSSLVGFIKLGALLGEHFEALVYDVGGVAAQAVLPGKRDCAALERIAEEQRAITAAHFTLHDFAPVVPVVLGAVNRCALSERLAVSVVFHVHAVHVAHPHQSVFLVLRLLPELQSASQTVDARRQRLGEDGQCESAGAECQIAFGFNCVDLGHGGLAGHDGPELVVLIRGLFVEAYLDCEAQQLACFKAAPALDFEVGPQPAADSHVCAV